jgi:hypothetical protein
MLYFMQNGDYLIGMSPMKQQFATHRYTVLKETAMTEQIVSRLTLNPLNTELNPICHLLTLLGAHHIFHISGLRVNPY